MTLPAIRRTARVLAACCLILTLTACGQGGETAPSSPQPSSPPSDVDVTLEHMEALPPPPARTPSPWVREDEVVTLTGLTLDGAGAGDDSAALWVFGAGEGEDGLAARLEVRLGTGQVLEHLWGRQALPSEGISHSRHYITPTLEGARLISAERDALVVGCGAFGSNYAAADYYVLEVRDGVLALRFQSPPNTVQDHEIVPGEGGGTDTLWLPEQRDKWEPWLWHAVRWEEGVLTVTEGDGPPSGR